ncbi:MAG TPA: FxLYD domain-containing protein, partial [Gemmatimonadaceae bacterium]|nr:FxLYD domain-containing protein [Gemmatimonadaceae bacterium]
KYTVTGMAENNTPGEKNTKIRFEFLDKTGKVVASEEAPLTIANGGAAKFTVEVRQPGIAAYRYQPVM